MLDAYFGTLAHDVASAVTASPRRRSGNRVLSAFANVFATSDGGVFINPVGEEVWHRLCVAFDRADWLETVSYSDALGDMRYEVERTGAEWASRRTPEEMTAELRDVSSAYGPVHSLPEAVTAMEGSGRRIVVLVTSPSGQQIALPGALVPFGVSEEPRARRVPRTGEDTVEVLRVFGMSRRRSRSVW